jgi:hypothetical protein
MFSTASRSAAEPGGAGANLQALINRAHLFHASHDAAILRFEPRPPPDPSVGPGHDCVWTVDHAHIANYLLPRDCPRVILRPGPATTPEDAVRFLGPAAPETVVAIEAGWLDAAQRQSLCLYAFEPGDPWRLHDANAGVHVSAISVAPVARHPIASPMQALLDTGAEVRLCATLWPLIDAVAGSSIAFSIIRKRNAQPRPR